MSITSDANSVSSAIVTGYPNSVSVNITIGSGANRFIRVVLFFSASVETTHHANVTVGGVAATFLTAYDNILTNGRAVQEYYLINPGSGVKAVVADLTPIQAAPTYTQAAALMVISYSGVHQTTPYYGSPVLGLIDYPATSVTLNMTAVAGNWGEVSMIAGNTITTIGTGITPLQSFGAGGFIGSFGDTNGPMSGGVQSITPVVVSPFAGAAIIWTQLQPPTPTGFPSLALLGCGC